MGRLESLTALALGRGPYEDHVVDWDGEESREHNGQLYNEHGHPRNPETRRREREHVRAANEVMQVTGIVEDSSATKAKAAELQFEKTKETFTGLRMMEAGRAVLIGGVWGVLGLRRRILLYRPYAEVGLFQILKRETAQYGLLHVIGSGLPTVVTYHVADWVAFLAETILDAIWWEDEDEFTPTQQLLKDSLQKVLNVGFCYITLHFRMFAILQQLNLIPSSRLLPSLKSFIPFLAGSPLLFPIPTLTTSSVASALAVLLKSSLPLLLILFHGRAKYFVASLLYRPIYKALPRPIGDSMFAGLQISPPTMEYDTPDRPLPRSSYRTEDEPTLRALEGLPSLERLETRTRPVERDSDSSADDVEMAQLISFDVEASQVIPESARSAEAPSENWSAELRSANDPPPTETRYRVTGLTMLPIIMATEGLREIVSGIVVMPLEALMVRCIGRLYRASAQTGVEDMYSLTSGFGGFANILSALTLQLGITGLVWAGFTVTTQWAAMKRPPKEKKETETSSDQTENTPN
ncbi:hypothetical protein LSUE1_G001401 [Lachnellula suecica]|uniref:Uncharacterized protein n=1 Tax=Lachnellula suecica TaxID=602035 RepID=A0A8T9CJU0_9HELO|nr:hypothetical protein LSUE1_G001401 [Lachnellula suecica]